MSKQTYIHHQRGRDTFNTLVTLDQGLAVSRLTFSVMDGPKEIDSTPPRHRKEHHRP